MKILVCGGRDYRDRPKVFDTLDEIDGVTPIIGVMHGGASGADHEAHVWASLRGKKTKVFMADWNLYGKIAGPLRNQRMLDYGKPDLVVAFPGGRGTADMVRRAKEAGVNVMEIE